jgi:uncharacterized protein YndB with AHSA1/START domain
MTTQSADTGPGKLAIVEHIDIDAAPEIVFRALTDPNELRAWWRDAAAPAGAAAWEVDPRVGGRWRSRWRIGGSTEFEISGQILAIDPPRLLCYSWNDARYPESGTTTVQYDIVPTHSGCRVTVTHSDLVAATPAFLDYSGGWSGVLELLARTV